MVDKNKDKFDEIIVDSIYKLKALRDDFIKVILLLVKYNSNIDFGTFQRFFENLIEFNFPSKDFKTIFKEQFDNFKFINYELFLYFIAILLKFEKFQTATHFINLFYFFKEQGEYKKSDISVFSKSIDSLDRIRKNRLGLKYYSVTGQFVKERADNKNIIFGKIIETDYLLFLITLLKNKNSFYVWFPMCSPYLNERESEFFSRMQSKTYFDKVKVLFGLKDINEFKESIITLSNSQEAHDFYRWLRGMPKIEYVTQLENIGTVD